ncbi:hypothetical protein C8R47DRAFT_1162736 [Mycena vitilis]|nr:hypothetical protein C8R47DRAFT_1162736 [Mycena vitilis]
MLALYLYRPCVRLGETPEERLGVLGHHRPSPRCSLRPCTIRPRCGLVCTAQKLTLVNRNARAGAWAGREGSAVSGSWTCSMSLVAWAMRKAVAGRRSILCARPLRSIIVGVFVCATAASADAVSLARTGAIAPSASAAASRRRYGRRSARRGSIFFCAGLWILTGVGPSCVPGQVSVRAEVQAQVGAVSATSAARVRLRPQDPVLRPDTTSFSKGQRET